MSDIFADDIEQIEQIEKAPASAKPADPSLKPDAPEPEPEASEADVDQDDNRGQFARKGDFAALRAKAEAAETAKREIERRYAEDMAKLADRLAVIAQQRNAPQAYQPPAPQIPNIEEDPIGHFQAKQAALEAKLEESERWRQAEQTRSRDQIKLQEIGSEVERLESEFTKTTPDYPEAQRHLFNTWAQEAQLMGVPADEAVKFWAMQIVQRAAQHNKNPAQLAYDLAKQRGYQAGGRERAPVEPVQQGPDLDRIAKGIATSKTPSSAPGKAPKGAPTIEALLAMDDDEFANQYGARHSDKWNRDVMKAFGLK